MTDCDYDRDPAGGGRGPVCHLVAICCAVSRAIGPAQPSLWRDATSRRSGTCRSAARCEFVWEEIRDDILDRLSATTFADLVERAGGPWRSPDELQPVYRAVSVGQTATPTAR